MIKPDDLRAMTVDQLDDELLRLKKEQFNLRFQRATGQLENSSRVRVVRRDIARVKTIAQQKEKKNVTHELVLVSLPRTVSTKEAEDEIKRLGLEKATTEDLLALGAKSPDPQRKFYIAALGSSAPRGNGYVVFPVLYGLDQPRSLDFNYCDNQWDGSYRFLARSKL